MNLSSIREHMNIIGGVHVGTVDKIEGGRIKLVRDDSGAGHHHGHHHYISGDLVADIEGDNVRIGANGDTAVGQASLFGIAWPEKKEVVLHESEGDGKEVN